MRLQVAKEPGALGELRKQRAIVARQPPIERTVAPAFQGMEQPQRDHLTSRAFRKFVTSYRRLCPRRKYDIGSKAT